MGITNSNKVINQERIDCDGSLRVTLAPHCGPGYHHQPHRHCAGAGPLWEHDRYPPGQHEDRGKDLYRYHFSIHRRPALGEIGSGDHIGIVSFANTAMQNTQMITSVDALKNAVDALVAGGGTNHADAFDKAVGLFDPNSSNAKVIVMFTDGKTTAGAPLPRWRRSPGPGHRHLLHRPAGL